MSTHIFGIRHHGPGSAHSLEQALQSLKPDIILIEGPPEADALLQLAHHPEMQPPIALLLYASEDTSRAVYYPFAEFSPEWRAIQYGLSRSIPIRFMDLPQSYQLGPIPEPESDPPEPAESQPQIELESPDRDPLSWLAKAAGDSDTERWWERLVEQRQDSRDVFAAILEAMTALRSELPEITELGISISGDRELRREAYMRKTIREAEKEGFATIAVVCGAWHAPALATMPPVKVDTDRLKGLTKTKVCATWVPWTQGRLANRTGYGAGIDSPGWYDQLWQAFRDSKSAPIATIWLTKVARSLRDEGIDASSASVIEAVRLAESLTAMRGYPLPGLAELNEATKAVLCFGDDLPMQVIHEQLIIADRLGQVPPETPMVPLQQDLQAQQKRLRLKPDPIAKELILDLRNATDLARSQLLHRLDILGIDWGNLSYSRSKGTFKETWQLIWKPTYEVRLIELGVWGNSVELAATAYLGDRAKSATLPQLTNLLDRAILAGLDSGLPALMRRIESEAAIAQDIAHLMEALTPLAQVLRYGNVRQVSATVLEPIVTGLVTRICIGLPIACMSLDDAAADKMDEQLLAVNGAIGLLQLDNLTAIWRDLLRSLIDQSNLAGLIAGRCCRLLLDAGFIDSDEIAKRFSLALSIANSPMQAASWIDGLLRGSGLLLLHNATLWQILDDWLSHLSSDNFVIILPLLRRTFSQFSAPERRQMGEQVSQSESNSGEVAIEINLDQAEAILPILGQLLGLSIVQ
jgi:hypothetical protein